MANPNSRKGRAPAEQEEIQPLNREQKRMITWLRKVRFKKKLFGGVSERDVWKKIEELNSMYNLALIAERARYDALLQEQWASMGDYASIDTNLDGKERGRP